MPITHNGTNITNIVFNGTTVATVVFNGTTVFSATQTTATPTIQNFSAVPDRFGFGAAVSWRVRNNDGSTATILSNLTTNPPTTSRGSIAAGGLTALISVNSAPQAGVVYATAQASGENKSAVASVSYSV